MKKCYLCKKGKPLNEFYKDSSRKDGVGTKCMECARNFVPTQKTVIEKYCPGCMQTLPLENFHRNNRSSDGLQTACKDCREAGKKRWEKEHADHRNDLQLQRRYGLSKREVDKLSSEQLNRCALCGKLKKLVVDHCHETGRIRGLLCTRCNVGLGSLGDNVEGLTKALQYVTHSSLV